MFRSADRNRRARAEQNEKRRRRMNAWPSPLLLDGEQIIPDQVPSLACLLKSAIFVLTQTD